MIDNKNISKLYRYEALLQAIDFFTQKFNLEQLSHYAFEFANNILSLNSSALFLKNGDFYELKKSKNYQIQSYSIPDSHKLKRIATFHGDIIISNFENFFSPNDIGCFNMKFVIPLLIQNMMYGFIISDGKALGEFDEDDLIIARTHMRLMNNSLENSKNFSDLQEINKQLDQKVFNLFSINQSSRILLSVLDMSKLYSLSTDIFSELTSSKITAFGLYDEIRNKIILRGYKNVFSSKMCYNEFELVDKVYRGYRIVFNYRNDKEKLEKIFVNYADFEELEAEYIILLVKDNILGFVTISAPVNERKYDQSLFELIESLASSTYISFRNAILFEEVNRQKIIIENKLNVLTKLNNLIKNINSCGDIEELCSLTIKALNISFGINKAFIALYDGTRYIIKDYVGFSPSSLELETNENLAALSTSGMLYKYSGEYSSNYLPDWLLRDVSETNCLAIAPICTDEAVLSTENQMLGYIIVLHTPEALKEEEILLIDTISSSIAPTINHMNAVNRVKREYVVNQSAIFLKELASKFANRKNYSIDFSIYYKKIPQAPFQDVDLEIYSSYEHFYFDNTLFVLSEAAIEEPLFDGLIEGENVDEVVANIKNI
ncbi:MAG: GAF domain-containing protein [Caulobacteraceae bacterium]